MITQTVLEWSYTPADVLEAAYRYVATHFEIPIAKGIAALTFTVPKPEIQEEDRLAFEDLLQNVVRAVQTLTHQLVGLMGPHSLSVRL